MCHEEKYFRQLVLYTSSEIKANIGSKIIFKLLTNIVWKKKNSNFTDGEKFSRYHPKQLIKVNKFNYTSHHADIKGIPDMLS